MKSEQKVYLVSVIVPCRNEKKYIPNFLESLLKQKLNNIKLEILIADGMSNDGTRDLLLQISNKYPNFKIIDNLQGIVSTGLNEAIRQASGDIIIRMDVHTEYAEDYIQKCVKTLIDTGADNVGGAWTAKGKNYLQNAIALAFQSPFSSGGAGSHDINKDGCVDSVYLGCWWKRTLLEVGLFDEELVRNQDDELNLRLTRAGKKVWQSSSIKSTYYPRSSIKSLFQQYAQYGYWKVRVIQKHRVPASIRHLVPGIFIGAILITGIGSIINVWMLYYFLMILGIYICTILIISLITCWKNSQMNYLKVLPFIFSAFHLGYGYGFLRGFVNFIVLKRQGEMSFVKLTRRHTS